MRRYLFESMIKFPYSLGSKNEKLADDVADEFMRIVKKLDVRPDLMGDYILSFYYSGLEDTNQHSDNRKLIQLVGDIPYYLTDSPRFNKLISQTSQDAGWDGTIYDLILAKIMERIRYKVFPTDIEKKLANFIR